VNRHTKGVMGSLVKATITNFSLDSGGEKKFENWSIFEEVMRAYTTVPIFGPPCMSFQFGGSE